MVTLARKGNPCCSLPIAGNENMTSHIANHQEHFVSDPIWLLEAERDLVYTFIGVKEIALSLGFSDAGYFSRFFSKHKRCTPTKFREQAHRQLRREKAG